MPRGVPFTDGGESLIQVALPPGTPYEAETAVRRLVELTAILARRCAQLQEALETRVVIEQAKGMLAERFHLEPERAFDVLRRSARSNRVALRDLAARVVSSERTPREIAAQLDGAAAPPRLARSAGSR
ncbi:MAG: ANTAR domain-containing protein [Actinobacteria bacterium]|nr:MAG: ANTAR domain-containing protein [Actinomycetota bacterium]